MQYIAPRIIHTEGLVKIRYRTICLMFAFLCTYYYGRYSYTSLTSISNLVSPKSKIRLDRQSTPPRNYIGFAASTLPRIISGRVSEMFSAKWVMFSAVLMLTICMSLMPMAAEVFERNIYLDVINVVMKFTYGWISPAAQVMLSRWSPPKERFVMCSLISSTWYFGLSLSVFVTTWLSVTIGWAYTFYFSAGLNVLLLFVWVSWVRDDPSEDEKIGEEEKKYIMDSLKDEVYQHRRRLESRAPWKDIFRSGPVWAALIGKFQYTFFTTLLDIQFGKESEAFRENNVMGPLNQAVILSMPPFWLAVVSFSLGLIFYNLLILGIEKVRVYRIAYFIFLLGSTINLVYFSYYEKIKFYKWETTSALSLSIAGYNSIYFVYFPEIAPNYSGTLFGLQDTVDNGIGFLLILLKKYDATLWAKVVTHCSSIFILLSAFVSLVYFSGDVQPWNNHCHLLAADDVYIDDDLELDLE